MPHNTPEKRQAYNKRKWQDAKHRRKHMANKYGVAPGVIEEVFATQDGKCYACKKPLKIGGTQADSTNIDHCHGCGKVRSVLCKWCNTALGFIDKNPEMFMNLFKYHQSHKESCQPRAQGTSR